MNSPAPHSTLLASRSTLPAAAPLPLARARALAVLAVVLLAAFGKPLYDLARFAAHSDLYSHILLIPAISLYLVWLNRRKLALDSEPARALAVLPLATGFALLAGYFWSVHTGWKPPTPDYLALMTLSFLMLLWGGLCLVLGKDTLRAAAFPIAFLIFMVPFPVAAAEWIQGALQHGSADVAYVFFKLSGMPVFRQGTAFQLPGFSLEVAPECSGIHSTLVLFITSLLAAYLLLRSRWARFILVLVIIPLGLLRNGFRVLVIGQLCVRISPDMINSPLHRRGGPIFFVLSLIPLFLLLWYLRKREARKLTTK